MIDSRIRLTSSTSPLADVECDWLVAGIWADAPLSQSLAALNARLGGTLERLRESGDISGKALESLALHDPRGIKAKRLIFIGLGNRAETSRRSLHDAAAAALRSITGKKYARVALAIPEASPLDVEQAILAIGVGAIQGTQGPGIHKSEPSRIPPEEIALVVPSAAPFHAIDHAVKRAGVEGSAVNLARTLVNSPPCELYPETFAARAAELTRGTNIGCEIWDEGRLQAEGMGAILGIAQGSTRPARLLILRYAGSGSKTLAYVGKGVTFDSGGLSLKSNEQMLDMKCDMAGAATVLSAICAISELKVPVNLLGVMPLVENMPGGYAVKLGDVLRSRSGKTIEILNTDAEGRVILADALAYAVEQKADHIVDLATLTGAVMIALGPDICGLMSNDDSWAGRVRSAILSAGERAWQLPMDADFGELLKSNVADCKNAPGVRYGGAIAGGKFLEQFVGKTPWVHLDIAGPAWAERESATRDAGGTGAYVRSLTELAYQYGG